jgi:hypothetical protein
MKCKVLNTDLQTDIPEVMLNATLLPDETEVSVCRPHLVKEGLALICLYRVGDTDNHRLRTLLVQSNNIGDDKLLNVWKETNSKFLPHFATIKSEFSPETLSNKQNRLAGFDSLAACHE